ncbi:restriction endonuclease subunit S [uncultured Brachyspira sp.]|uniref:restriction endonuclease subunit S n=4 Tax=uncultured Brachyspira sp. TaxID=221953 RepID=UPI0025CCD3C6|nr:restriction endonuclease subunit S [uncultured Brachyspira sp.]
MTHSLPAGWQEVKLKDICNIQDGIHTTPNYVNKGIRFISVENINNIYSSNKFISNEDYNNLYKVKAKKNDIFMTRIGDIGTPAIVTKDEELAYYVTISLLSNINKKIYYKYLYYIIQSYSFQRELYARTLHVAFPKKINLGEIGECKFISPPLDEQKRIASVLSLCDEAIENLNKLIYKKELYKKGVMQRVLTGEVRFEGFTDEWKEIKISELVQKNIIFIEKGKAISKNKIIEGNIPVIAGGKIPAYYHSEYTHDFPCITISASGSAGYVWFHNYKIWASDCNVLYTENKKYNINFLYYYLNHIQEYIYNLQIGGVQPHVYAKDIITLTVPNIGIEEQNKIASFLSLIDGDIDNLKKLLELRKEQKKGLMQRLLTGEIRI